MTNVRAGIESVFEAMINRKTKNQVTGVILLSDGIDNHGFENNSKKLFLTNEVLVAWKSYFMLYFV